MVVRLTLHGWRVQLHDLDLRVPELLTEHCDESVHCGFAGAVVEGPRHWNYTESRGRTVTQGCQRQGLPGALARHLAVYTHRRPGRPPFDILKCRRLFSGQPERQAGSVRMDRKRRRVSFSLFEGGRRRKTYYMIADSLSLLCKNGKKAFVRATPLI